MDTQIELHITLAKLVEIGACSEARRRFVQVFGEDAAPSAREVFINLAEEERQDWLFWLGYNLQGFAQAVGTFSIGNFHCLIGGRLDVAVGCVLAYGNASVRAYGNASVLAYGNASVEADGNASVEAYGNASVRAYGNASVEADGNASVRAYGNASVEADGNASVEAYGNASVRADGNASVEADGNASVEAYGNATLFLFRYADMTVKFSLKSIFACVIDRRGDGIPKLITVTQAEVEEK